MTSVSEIVYIHNLDDIVNIKIHITAQLKESLKTLMMKILSLKLLILLLLIYVPNWFEEVFVIKKVKNTVPWTYVISDLKGEEIIGTFYEKELQKTNEKEFRAEKVIKRKGDKLYIKWKGYDSYCNSGIYKKDIVQMSEYFPESTSSGGEVKVELDLSNYAIKGDLKNAIGVDKSKFAKKVNLANLKSNVDK